MEWLKSRKEKEVFSNIEFAVLGLGNRTFERFCGNSVSFREALLGGGGREMV
jgi:sulfite reductase alpha subunit-like flavoprotein